MRLLTVTVCMVALLAATAVRADNLWQGINCNFQPGTENKVVGPDRAFISVKPKAGPWTASFVLGNRFANMNGADICVFSAQTVTFLDYFLAAGHAQRSSYIIFKIDLSDSISAFTWDINEHHIDLTAQAKFTARYSTDGKTWVDAYKYPSSYNGVQNPDPISISLKTPTKSLYLGWWADVPDGQSAYWWLNNTGRLTFAPFPISAQESVIPSNPLPAGQSPPLLLPSGQRYIPNSFFATTTHYNWDYLFPLLADLNIHTVRLDFPFATFSPSRGKYDFSADNVVIQSADRGLEHGFDQLPIVTSYPPNWASRPDDTFPIEDAVDEFEDFTYRLALKYKGKIKYWQAMNEPDMAVWRDRFVLFLKAFYQGVKRADPENKVVLCGFAGNESLQLESLYHYGGKDYFDILAAHPYTRPKMPEDGGYLDKIRELYLVMRKNGDDKPLWVTEMGWCGVESSMLEYLQNKFPTSHNNSCTEEQQARGLVRLFLISATIPWIERVYFFHLHSDTPYISVVENADFYMGLVTPWQLKGQSQITQRPKDAYFAVKTVIEMIGDSTYHERIATDPNIWALVFLHKSKAVVALWCPNDNIKITLKDISMIRGITSMVGTPVLVAPRLSLSGRPIYLECDLDKIDMLKKQIRQAVFESGS